MGIRGHIALLPPRARLRRTIRLMSINPETILTHRRLFLIRHHRRRNPFNFVKWDGVTPYNNAFIFWGEDDSATSLKSGEKIASLIKKSIFTSYSGDHYFFLKHAKNICERVENGIS